MKKLMTLLLILFSVSAYSQNNITNTLGTGGIFTIKDASNDFLTLSQSTGNLSLNRSLILPVMTAGSQTGVIYRGIDRFIHTFRATGTFGSNLFIGINAGNFTMFGNVPSDASYNTGVGLNSLSNLTIGYQNSAFGQESMFSNTTGYYNSSFGYQSMFSNTDGYYNSAFGYGSCFTNTTGFSNAAFGYLSLYNNNGNGNSAFGSNAMRQNTTGIGNSAFGHVALATNTTGKNNSAFGISSLAFNSTGDDNSAFGMNALYTNSTGYQNSAFGRSALFNSSTGIQNSAVGDLSLAYNTTGSQNSALGYKSLFNNGPGFQNTAIGDSALYNNTGNYNTALGFNSGSNITTGANLTCIGTDASPTTPTAIDQITLGNIFVTSLRCNVTTITSLSDARDKKNIKDLGLGINFLMKLKPRLYNWDKREWYDDNISDGSKMKDTPTAGFIAQELDEVQTSENAEWLNLVLKDNPEKLEATPGNLLPIVVKAIQDLKTENDLLKKEVEGLKTVNEKLAKLEQLVYELTTVKNVTLTQNK